jgi:hypothetical protein
MFDTKSQCKNICIEAKIIVARLQSSMETKSVAVETHVEIVALEGATKDFDVGESKDMDHSSSNEEALLEMVTSAMFPGHLLQRFVLLLDQWSIPNISLLCALPIVLKIPGVYR